MQFELAKTGLGFEYNKAVYVEQYEGRDDAEHGETRWCDRCQGAAIFDIYIKVNGGVCFKCNGAGGKHEMTIGALRAEDRAAVDRHNRAERIYANKAGKQAARVAKLEAAHPELVGLRKLADRSDFLMSLWGQLFERDLTDRQVSAAVASVARDNQYQAEKLARESAKSAMTPLTEGRQLVEGKVTKIKIDDNDFSPWGGSVIKGTIETTTGHRVYGTLPKALFDQLDAEAGTTAKWDSIVGREVSFTAAITPTADDNSFGFFKRPTKAIITK